MARSAAVEDSIYSRRSISLSLLYVTDRVEYSSRSTLQSTLLCCSSLYTVNKDSSYQKLIRFTLTGKWTL